MSGEVLLVLHEPHVGGASNAVLRVLPLMEREGWHYRVWAPRPSPVAELLARRGYEVAGEPRPFRYRWRAARDPPGVRARIRATPGYLRRFRGFVAGIAPDLVHANTVVTLPEALLSRSTRVATMLHVHEMLSEDARGAAAARLAGRLDHVATVSQASAGPLRARGLDASIITAGVEAVPVGPAVPRDRPLVVGTLATVSHRKGSDLFVAAAIELLRSRPDIEFRMVGPLAPGAQEAWARELVGRAESVGIRCGVAPDPLAELREWDLFVLPARRDPFPLAVLEAMSVGLPVIASRVDGIPEQLDQASGALIDPNDPSELRGAIEGLLDDRGSRTAMGRSGRSRARACFTPERHARELSLAYRKTLTAAAARGA